MDLMDSCIYLCKHMSRRDLGLGKVQMSLLTCTTVNWR